MSLFLDINKSYIWLANSCALMVLKRNAKCKCSVIETHFSSLDCQMYSMMHLILNCEMNMPKGSIRCPECYGSNRRREAISEKLESEGNCVELLCSCVDLSLSFFLGGGHQLYTEYIRSRNVNPTIVFCLNNSYKFSKIHLGY